MGGLSEGVQLAGRYSLIKPLRSGGNADVWQARDTLTGADVALKVIRSGGAAELAAEFEHLEALSHPGIVRAHELGKHNGHAYLVLELIAGVELSQYMGANCLTWLPMLRQVVDALTHAHGRGVVHGDLKLENMLVTDTGSVLLVDFSQRPGQVATDDIHALGGVISELATGLPGTHRHRAAPPVELARLIADMTGAKPVSLPVVAARIDAVLNDPMKPGESEQFERIKPVARQVERRDRSKTVTGRRPQFGWWLAGLVVVSIVAIVSLKYWPRLFPDTGDSIAATDQVDEARARLDDLSQQTQKESSLVYQKWMNLEVMDVSTWAELRAQRALELLQKGEQQASKMNHVAALRLLGESDALFSALLEQAPGIAADRRAAGWQAYRSGDAETAAKHFRVVLAIEPDDDAVRTALNRTAYLEQTTELTRQARELESNGDLNGALEAMRKALQIDPGNVEFEQEMARLESELQATGFQATMSKVYAALRAKNYSAARQSLRKAAGLRPGAPELRDATTQLELAERGIRIADLRGRAVEAEKAEHWEEAIELYSELLRIDPGLVLAQQGRDRSRRLASLTAQAESLLTATLSKDGARDKAETLLEQIASVKARSPALQSLALQLREAVRLSRLPVRVQLQSDNLTDVRVYRVGDLGQFESHELELMPGQYTVIGTRAGYRDVRTQLVVEAGKESTSLIILCEEQI